MLHLKVHHISHFSLYNNLYIRQQKNNVTCFLFPAYAYISSIKWSGCTCQNTSFQGKYKTDIFSRIILIFACMDIPPFQCSLLFLGYIFIQVAGAIKCIIVWYLHEVSIKNLIQFLKNNTFIFSTVVLTRHGHTFRIIKSMSFMKCIYNWIILAVDNYLSLHTDQGKKGHIQTFILHKQLSIPNVSTL